MNKCRILGHDYTRYHRRGEKKCTRCGKVEEYDADEQHEDPDAEKGETRFVFEEDKHGYWLSKEVYRCTAWGEDSEYWQWSHGNRLRVSKEDVDTLKEAIDALEE